MKSFRLLVAVAAASYTSIALAESSPLLWQSAVVDADTKTAALQTLPMPKGWFSSKNVLDRTKSNLRVEFSFEATTCSVAQSGDTRWSSLLGNFTPVMNPPDKNATAYVWDAIIDVASFQNHWHYYQGCDGSLEKLGCDQAKPTVFTVTAFDKTGVTCHSYTNDAGVTVCASDTTTASLPAVQDATVVVDPAECEAPGTNCGIGQCERACVQTCNDLYPVGGRDNKGNNELRQQCVDACPCACKDQRPAGCPNNCSE